MITLSQNMIGKKLSVFCQDGTTYTGICTSYIQALDNSPEVESISIADTEIFKPDIKSIKLYIKK